MKDYITWSESHNNPSVNIWAFICGFILLILNLVGKNIKNAYEEEYAVRKIVESFYNMQIIQDFHSPDGEKITEEQYNELFLAATNDIEKPVKEIETDELRITNKQSLKKYLTNSFADLFFTPYRFVQQKMRIVGPVRLRTIHTLKKDKCSFDTKLNACYF